VAGGNASTPGSPAAADADTLRGLVERIRSGDPSAETELVQEFTQRVLVMAVVRTRDRDAARELVQDVLMAVVSALRRGQLRDSSKLVGFVHGTARNLINNWLRREALRPRLEPLSDDVAQAGSAAEIEDAERMRLVREALSSLGDRDRSILWMTLAEGRKPGEIASALGITSEVVRTRKLRAVKKITRLIHAKMSRK
jgi:RNA polymerase sigma factor (sigma-70 family)